MPLLLDRVQVYGNVDGHERIISYNPYKMFEKRIGDKGSETQRFIAQGGKWYSIGGEEIPYEDVPEWVWIECRAMNGYDRGLYRILLPEERKAGQKVPTFEQQEEYPTKQDILKALLSLDPADDSHWTKDGLPSLEAVKQALKVAVSRRRIDSVSPAFVRPAH